MLAANIFELFEEAGDEKQLAKVGMR